MHNLMGRLHARGDDDLARIAEFWGVDAGRTRQSLIALLFRVLSDPRAVRDAWQRLQADERAMVRALALAPADDAEPTVPQLAERLGVTEPAARETASRLYRFGILAREHDDDPLPVGEVPRLLLPRELTSLFRRVQDELDAGDLSSTPLRALLELLDDAEIEAAAAIWGIPVVPGLRGRADLGRRLLKQLGDPGRVADVVAGRGRDAARLWQVLRDEPAGAAVPLARAVADADLAGDEPRLVKRRRDALEELESVLLVWHSYRGAGERWLFVPGDVRTPKPPNADTLPPLQPVIAPTLEPPPPRHPHALAWDLLTLLRELVNGAVIGQAGELSRPLARRLNGRFWHRGVDAPPSGYVELLVALARAEGLVEDEPAAGGEHRSHLILGPAMRPWREREFVAQSERLRWWWLAATDWIEGRGRAEVEVWGADWRGARRRLEALLGDAELGLGTGEWYALDSVAARIAARDPELLGATFTAATARAAGDAGAGGDEEEARAAAIADVVRVEMETAFAWFGLVELADIPGQTRALRRQEPAVPPAGDAPTPSRDSSNEPAAHPLVAQEDGLIELLLPTPVRVWALSAFAEIEALGAVSRYRLTSESLGRALAAGFDLDQVATFLARQGGRPLPAPLVERLDGWARNYRRVRVHSAVVVAPDDPALLPTIRQLLESRGFGARPLDDGSLLVEPPAASGDPTALVLTRLREGGYAPHNRPPTNPRPAPTRRDGTRER